VVVAGDGGEDLRCGVGRHLESHGELSGIAPRLTELMTQLDADGHNTTQLRLELESLIDELGMNHFYR